MTQFIFDLDGTVTSQETLPLISKKFNIQDKIDSLTIETVKGNIPFIESFIRRVYILGELPIDEVSNLLENVEVYKNVVKFINEHKNNCVVATGNLECWIKKLSQKIGCCCYCSDVSIASGLTHMPANGVLSVADYLVLNEEGLCRQLNQLL